MCIDMKSILAYFISYIPASSTRNIKELVITNSFYFIQKTLITFLNYSLSIPEKRYVASRLPDNA